MGGTIYTPSEDTWGANLGWSTNSWGISSSSLLVGELMHLMILLQLGEIMGDEIVSLTAPDAISSKVMPALLGVMILGVKNKVATASLFIKPCRCNGSYRSFFNIICWFCFIYN